MTHLPPSIIFLGIFTISITGITTLFGCSSVHSQESVTEEKEYDQTDPLTDDYWTPERLKEAKPIEMPSPENPAPHTPDGSMQAPSVDAPGHSGDEDITPDETNQLFENPPPTKP